MQTFFRCQGCIRFHEADLGRKLGGGGHLLIKVRGGSDTKAFLPRVLVKQLKLLPTVDTTSHFLHPRADILPQMKNCNLESTET